MELTYQLIEYANKSKDTNIDKPFKKFPDYQVLRHKDSGKWFGLIMPVEKSKLGLDGTGNVDLLDVKINPEMNSILRNASGYLPAYHMNKEHWISIILDGTVEWKQIINLLKESYSLTN